MLWEVERDGRRSFLAGTAPFFPYRLEGPLDEEPARLIVAYGSEGGGGRSLVEALDPGTIRRISRELGGGSRSLSSRQMFRSLTGTDPEGLDWDRLKGVRPWMAFFRIWSRYLQPDGWTHNMELGALRIAGELGRPVRFLQTIAEQLVALDAVPFERLVRFLSHVDWKRSRRDHQACYLRGDLDGLLARVGGYPTVCEAVIGRRDPILSARMQPLLREGLRLWWLFRSRLYWRGSRPEPPPRVEYASAHDAAQADQPLDRRDQDNDQADLKGRGGGDDELAPLELEVGEDLDGQGGDARPREEEGRVQPAEADDEGEEAPCALRRPAPGRRALGLLSTLRDAELLPRGVSP